MRKPRAREERIATSERGRSHIRARGDTKSSWEGGIGAMLDPNLNGCCRESPNKYGAFIMVAHVVDAQLESITVILLQEVNEVQISNATC